MCTVHACEWKDTHQFHASLKSAVFLRSSEKEILKKTTWPTTAIIITKQNTKQQRQATGGEPCTN